MPSTLSGPGALSPSARMLLARQQEMRVWDDRLRACRAGGGGVVLLTGEAGIGKSRLVEECLADAGPAHVVLGFCPPVAGTDLPYAAVLQGLRGLGRSLSPAQRELLDGWAPDVASLLFPSSLSELPVSRTAQVRLFEGLLGVLARLAEQRPVLFVVEDLHWADRSTLDLLAFLIANVRGERILLLLTARDDLGRGHPLRTWLAEVSRLPQTQHLQLTRLDRVQTGQLLQALLGERPPPVLVDAVFDRAEGNPLFTELLLPEVRAGDVHLPPLLHDLLLSRFTQLGEEARALVRVASTVGRTVRADVLAGAVDLEEEGFDRALRELVDSAVRRPDRDGVSVDFTHELVREAAYSELLPGERRRVHARIAGVLERTAGAADGIGAGAIAHHYLAAGREADALPLLVAAGLAAERTSAFAEALRLLTQADGLWDRVDGADEVSPLGRVDVIARAAQAADLLGEYAEAVALVERALAVLEPADRLAEARLHERCGTYSFNMGDAAAAEASYARALDLLPPDPPTRERAAVLAGLAMLAMTRTELPEATDAARESIVQAQATGALREEGRARQALGVVVAWGGHLDAGVAELQAAARIAAQIGDPDDSAITTINLGHVLGVAGRYDEAVRVSLAGYEAARAPGLQREHGGHMLANAADALRKTGRWEEAERVLAEARAGGTRGLRAFPLLLQTSWLALRRGDPDAALAHLDGARALLTSTGGGPVAWRREVLELAAELAASSGQAADAAALVDEAMGLTERAGEPRSAGPLVTSGLRAAADDAERGRAGRDPALVRTAVERAEVLHARALRLSPCPVRDEGCLPETPALAELCAGELGRARGRPDPAAWQRAVRAWQALSRPYEAAYAGWRAAEALFADGQPEVAAEVLRTAHDTAESLGAAALQDELQALAGWRRVALQVLEPAPPADADRTLGLTSRELEVLTRVTAGQTNREIAEALFISVKTASVHVSNILRKLEVSRREDAARVGRQVGLLPRPRPRSG